MRLKNIFSISYWLAIAASIFYLPMSRAADFTVVNVGMSSFLFNSASNNPTLTLMRGTTYTFAVSSPGHPFDIKTNSSTGSINRYNNGVTGQGSMSGTLTFAVPLDAPTPLQYNCEVHIAMHGVINLVNPPNSSPTVIITNPVAGAAFLASTNLVLYASASDVDGTVTNVQFFSSALSLGSVTNNIAAGSFVFTNNTLAAGNYTFTAVASDNLGGATTSAAVTVFLLTNAVIAAPSRFTNGQTVFSLSGIAGQTYTTELSTNLSNWTPFLTNTAPANIFNITDFTSTNVLQRFYRTRQDF